MYNANMGRNREIGSAHSYLFTNLISVFGVYTKLETFSPEDGSYITARTMQHTSSIIHHNLTFSEFDYHSLRHPYVKPTTKKFTTFFEDFWATA